MIPHALLHFQLFGYHSPVLWLCHSLYIPYLLEYKVSTQAPAITPTFQPAERGKVMSLSAMYPRCYVPVGHTLPGPESVAGYTAPHVTTGQWPPVCLLACYKGV